MSQQRTSAVAIVLLFAGIPAMAAEPASSPHQRQFRLTYAVTVTGLEAGQAARLWMPVPPDNDEQRVQVVEQSLPGASQQAREPKYGNDILYVAAAADRAGQVTARTVYGVTREEARGTPAVMMKDNELAALFLKPDARVPVGGKPLTLLAGKSLPMDQMRLGRVLYDVVNGHMRYSKEGTGWGLGDAVWACDSKYGNCSDFHSLFISLARSQGVPAKFEIGFPLPPARGRGEIAGYHCWAWFQPRGFGWVPVDISEANKNPELREYYFGNLTENRVTLSTGRDLVLAPPQAGPPLNFFVTPYVEVAGKPYPAEKVQLKLQYEDVEGRP
ncbi:MAG TPA: transglutaminase-like domain-containing protein [Pirellulaceae bacterium]|nr:transglutaminase-like domain-containing protein [Pirellulaceae bacterium]